MTNFSTHPVRVDGVRLDTHAIGLEVSALTLGALRAGDTVLAGLDGEVPSLHDPREPSIFSMGMLVRGTDEDGVVPTGRDPQAVYQENLQALKHLLCQQGRTILVERVVDTAASLIMGTADAETDTDVMAYCKVVDSITPDDLPSDAGRVVAALKVPGVYWRSVAEPTWSQAAVTDGTAYEIDTLEGSSAPIEDAIVALTGPADPGVEIVDVATGYGVRLSDGVAAGDVWRVNAGSWESRVGAGLTVDSADTAGADKAATTDQSGTYPRLLRLHPRTEAGVRKVKIMVNGSGFTGDTALAVKARRAYL